MNAYTLLPFRDIHEDQFWKVGWINFKELRGYLETNFTKLFYKLELKPWLPIEDLKNELAKCGVQYKYVSLSQQQFVYDKDVGSFMNLMKFSCVLTEEENIIFGVGLQRFKFRLKEVFLNRQKLSNKHTYWASTTRPITIKDMQKLMEHFTSKFADEIHSNFVKEMRKLNIKDEGSNSYESIEEEEEETTDKNETSTEISTTTLAPEESQEFFRQADISKIQQK
uniref:Uncharacterized protein n=1 Tax=Acrobeloides nanus TaxID=290746 RepID=A0A914D553_9BILA